MYRHCSGEVYFRNVNIGKEIQQGQDWNELKGRKKMKKSNCSMEKKTLSTGWLPGASKISNNGENIETNNLLSSCIHHYSVFR